MVVSESSKRSAEQPMHRGSGSIATRVQILIALAVAPLAWLVTELFSFALAASVCKPASPLDASFPHALEWIRHASLVALLLGLAATAWAFVLWFRARANNVGPPIDIAEERTRFLTTCAALVSSGFSLALLFTSLGIWVYPWCRA
jgi:hypothetical protein